MTELYSQCRKTTSEIAVQREKTTALIDKLEPACSMNNLYCCVFCFTGTWDSYSHGFRCHFLLQSLCGIYRNLLS